MTRRWPRPCAIRWSGISSASQRASERNGCSGGWTVSATATATFPGGLTRFWLQSSLKISPREQVGLLRALFNGSLPFAAEDIAVVKRDITLSSGKGVRFMGKTGSGSDDADRGIIGWFVGGVETPHNRWSFAVNIQEPDASGVRARGIAEAALERLSILP